MTTRFELSVGFLAIMALAAGCGSSSEEVDSGNEDAAATAFGNLNVTINKLAVTSEEELASARISSARRGLGLFAMPGDWTAATMGDPRNSGGSCQFTTSISPQQFMTIDLDKNAVRCNNSSVNVFGRIKTGQSLVCAFAHLLTAATSADLPSSGDATFTLESSLFPAIKENCGLDLEAEGMTSAVFDMTFSTPSDTTYFDRKITGTVTSVSAEGSNEMEMSFLLKYGGDMTSVAMNEHNGNGSTRTVVIHDLSSNVMKAEYLAGSNSTTVASLATATLHRLYYDGENGFGRIYSSIEVFSGLTDPGSSPDQSNGKYVLTANPDDLTQPATLGMSYAQSQSGDLNACLTISDMSATDGGTVTAGKFSCSGTEGIDDSLMTADAAAWDFIRGNVDAWEGLSTAPSLSWTKDTMYTLAPAQY